MSAVARAKELEDTGVAVMVAGESATDAGEVPDCVFGDQAADRNYIAPG